MGHPVLRRALCLAPVLFPACDATLATHPEDPLAPSALRGALVFQRECTVCHTAVDGLDLAFFSFTDTTIIRRALGHVDLAEARDIVAHVRSLPVAGVSRDTRLFQPGGSLVSNDVAFASALFGADRWPAALTTEQLMAIDPRRVRVAFSMPLWSEEGSNLDWLPSRPLPEGMLDDRGQLARATIAGYYAAPTRENLARAVIALRTADRRMLSPDAPCTVQQPEQVDFLLCFEARRWTSALVAQHMFRYGIEGALDPVLHDVWWDVGNAARHSFNARQPIDNAVQNWAVWMYMGWSFDPSRHASVYTGNGLRRLGLPRHATFVALRSLVARSPGTAHPYADARNAITFAPDAWVADVAAFGFRNLLERISAGDFPRGDAPMDPRDQMAAAIVTVQRRAGPERRAALLEAAREILERLDRPR